MIYYELLTKKFNKLKIQTCYDITIRIPTVEELQNKDFDEVYVCDVPHTLRHLNSLNISTLSPIVKWFVTKWKRNWFNNEEEIKDILDRGLIVIKRQDRDRIDIWIKKTTSVFKISDIYVWDYWTYKYIRKKLSISRNPNEIISAVFDTSIAINTIMNKL